MMKFAHIFSIQLLLVFFVSVFPVSAQFNESEKVYQFNRKIEIPVNILLSGTASLGYAHLANKKGIGYEQALSFKPEDIWFFDRPATQQNPEARFEAHETSDVIMRTTLVLPFLLSIDRKVQQEWLNVFLLYWQAQMVNSNLYAINNAIIGRPRPFNYNPHVPVEEKMANESRNAFYSGHVSSTASASFFMAKVYSDFHPELGNKKYWLFVAAAVPPALVGYYRFRAMKHFPTDIIVGFCAGAASGILIPHLHKSKNRALSVFPYAGRINGLQVNYTF